MHPRSPSIFKDFPVRILAGQQKTIFYVYPGVLASSGSPVLEARVSSRWNENGSNEAIDWSNFDEETVGCVLRYLNYEDYEVSSPMNEEEEPEEKEDGTMSTSQQEIDTTEATKASLIHLVPELPLMEATQTTQTEEGSSPNMSNADGKKIGHIALLHAKIYCFAHHLLLSKLEELALQHLSQLLIQCDQPSESFLVRLKDAVRLIYDSTPRSKTNDPARELLSEYIALKYAEVPEEIIHDLIADEGDFAFDLPRKLALRISTIEKANKSLEWVLEAKAATQKLETLNAGLSRKLKRYR